MTEGAVADSFQASIVVETKVTGMDDGLCASLGSNLVEEREVAADISNTGNPAARTINDIGGSELVMGGLGPGAEALLRWEEFWLGVREGIPAEVV